MERLTTGWLFCSTCFTCQVSSDHTAIFSAISHDRLLLFFSAMSSIVHHPDKDVSATAQSGDNMTHTCVGS